MGLREIATVVLLGLAALTVTLSGVGLLAAPRGLARIHFITPVTSVAGPLTGVAYAVDQGWGLAAALALLTVGLLAFSAAPLGAAIGRSTARAEDLLPQEPAP